MLLITYKYRANKFQMPEVPSNTRAISIADRNLPGLPPATGQLLCCLTEPA